MDIDLDIDRVRNLTCVYIFEKDRKHSISDIRKKITSEFQ